MKQRRWFLPLLSLFVLACSCLPASLFTSDGGNSSRPENTPTGGLGGLQGDPGNYEDFRPFAGQWTGTWNNTTSGTTGSVDATLSVQTDGTASLALTVTGDVFGVGFSSEIDVPGTYDSYTLVFQATDLPVFGSLWISLDPAGSVGMQANAVPVEGVASVSAQGRMTGDSLTILYQVFLSNNQMVAGTASLTHAP